jgi:ribosomal protein S18 acetylase RimI-like enzyme
MDHKRGEPGRLGPADVGHRVVVRRYVGVAPSGRPQFSDLLGELVAADAGALTVRTERGDEHVVAVGDVAAAKRVGPRPARYSEIIALETAADEAWPAPETERLGGWILRAAEGFTSRANSALPLGDAGVPLDEAVDTCVAWYRARDLTPRITVPLPLRRDVADALTARGWHAQPVVLVQTARLDGLPPVPPTPLADAPSDDVLAVVRARKAALPDAARSVLTGPAQVRFAELRGDDGTLLATARGAVVREWVHLGLVEVAAAARRRGHGQRVSLALMAWGRGLGASRAVLQVEQANEAAVALYGRLGFATHHRYVTYADRLSPGPGGADGG